jgi:uncharacterized protein (DUF3820 family)
MELTCKICGCVDEPIIEDRIFSNNTKHIEAKCKSCGRHIQYLPQDIPIDQVIMPFGKYEGEKLVDIDRKYLNYLVEKNMVKGNLKKQILEVL